MMQRRRFWQWFGSGIGVLGLILGVLTMFHMRGHWGEEIRFTVHQSSVWFPSVSGVYVNAAGELVGFARDGLEQPWWALAPRPDLSVFEIHSGWFGIETEKLGQIDPAKLAEMVALIEAAAQGQNSEIESRCFDSGLLVYEAFPPGQKAVTLQVEGDFFYYNTSSAAQALQDWLQTLQMNSPYAMDMGPCGQAGPIELPIAP